MKKYILLKLIIAGLAAFKCNTTRHITGTVYGADDKLPIPGATVKIKGTNAATYTNQSGGYTLNVPDGSTLVVSFIGYQTKTVTIGKSDTLDVYLDPSSLQLGEVVVTQSLGIRHIPGNLGYSASTIQPRELTQSDVENVAKSLNGNAAGVSVATKGAPIAGTTVTAPGSVTYKSTASAARATFNKSLKYYNNNTSNPEDESYKTINENGFSNAKDNPLSTFSVDVDAASYSNVRRFINNGQLPPVDAVRR